ncbi:MAG: sigma-54-dependent transcriptional regulator, partial [Candidatus Kapaibacteriota bacterium]
SIRSQLFGHIKGAYTGAISNKEGVFHRTGTIVLDDIHHIPREIQAILLQIIESKTFYRLGDDFHPIRFNGRIIATSIYPPNELIEKYLLKELFWRLAGDEIHIPHLNARKEDIPLIINHFLSEKGLKIEFDEFLIRYLQEHRWEGNVREFLQVIHRLIAHSDSNKITLDDYKKQTIELNNTKQKLNDFIYNEAISIGLENLLVNIRKEIITKLLKENRGNINRVSKVLGYKNHQGLIYWLKKLNIEPDNYKSH